MGSLKPGLPHYLFDPFKKGGPGGVPEATGACDIGMGPEDVQRISRQPPALRPTTDYPSDYLDKITQPDRTSRGNVHRTCEPVRLRYQEYSPNSVTNAGVVAE